MQSVRDGEQQRIIDQQLDKPTINHMFSFTPTAPEINSVLLASQIKQKYLFVLESLTQWHWLVRMEITAVK